MRKDKRLAFGAVESNKRAGYETYVKNTFPGAKVVWGTPYNRVSHGFGDHENYNKELMYPVEVYPSNKRKRR